MKGATKLVMFLDNLPAINFRKVLEAGLIPFAKFSLVLVRYSCLFAESFALLHSFQAIFSFSEAVRGYIMNVSNLIVAITTEENMNGNFHTYFHYHSYWTMTESGMGNMRITDNYLFSGN